MNSVHHTRVTLVAWWIFCGLYCNLSNKIVIYLKNRILQTSEVFLTVIVLNNAECFNKLISNWAKCIKLKLVIFDWVSKQPSDTSFSVRSADQWIMLSFSLEKYDYQEDKEIFFGIRKEYHTHTHTLQSQSTWDTSLVHISACSFWPIGITCAPFWRWQGPPGWLVCRLCLPMNMHCVCIHVDGFLVFPAWCH